MSDWSNQFKSLLGSPLGKELLRSLREDLHDSLIKEAQQAENAEVAFGLLKEASGVIKSVNHLQFLGVVPSNEDSKV